MPVDHQRSGSEMAADTARLWWLARGRGMDQRRFLQLLAAGGAAAVLAACTGPVGRRATPAASDAGNAKAWFKDTAPFIVHDDGRSLEARLENMEGLITPSHLFFVRNNSVSLDVDVANWRLSVTGDAVTNPLELTYDDVRKLPRRTLVAYLECAGNQRAMFDLVQGQAAAGTQWKTGGVSNGEWGGVSLRDVLSRAGITKEAVSVLLIGLDTEAPEGGFRRVIPVEKALHPDTLLAYTLNGTALPRDHGFPLRALVPGWVGSTSVKWLGRIVVSAERLWTRNNTTSYVLIGDDYPPEGCGVGPSGDDSGDQERAGAAVAGRATGRLAPYPRLCPLAGRAAAESRVESRWGADVAGSDGARAARCSTRGRCSSLSGMRGTGRVHRDDPCHRRGGQYPAARRFPSTKRAISSISRSRTPFGSREAQRKSNAWPRKRYSSASSTRRIFNAEGRR